MCTHIMCQLNQHCLFPQPKSVSCQEPQQLLQVRRQGWCCPWQHSANLLKRSFFFILSQQNVRKRHTQCRIQRNTLQSCFQKTLGFTQFSLPHQQVGILPIARNRNIGITGFAIFLPAVNVAFLFAISLEYLTCR